MSMEFFENRKYWVLILTKYLYGLHKSVFWKGFRAVLGINLNLFAKLIFSYISI